MMRMAALQKTLQQLPHLELPPPAIVLSQQDSSSNQQHALPSNDSDDNDTTIEEENDETAAIPFEQLMNCGSYLRQLRHLALTNEYERQAKNYAESVRHYPDAGFFCEEKKEEEHDDIMSASIATTVAASHVEELEDSIHILPTTKEKVLDYNSYLAHQRYYDDLKHIDIKYIDFGNITNAANNGDDSDGGRLIVEQQKRLGKGGFCWNAGFILGEHVIAHEGEWNANNHVQHTPPRVVELGAGTGLTGLMIAKATKSHVVITDLPELKELMNDNIRRNFGGGGTNDASFIDEYSNKLITYDDKRAKGTITSRVLRWGIQEDYQGAPYDVIIGADIVTSLYDPVALAQALYALSGPNTKIYISVKARLDKPHEEFDVEMERLFERVEKIDKPSSRLRSPDVFIVVAEGKKRF